MIYAGVSLSGGRKEKMRSGVMIKSKRPRTELERKVFHVMTGKQRDDNYDLNELRTEPRMPN